MSMKPFNGDLTQSLKWMQNNAPNIQSLVNQKQAWFDAFHNNFWSQWEANIFNINTATNFGLMIWCIILGVPASSFNFYDTKDSWGFGANRENFIYVEEEGQPVLANPNLVGGNFYGGDNAALSSPDEIRKALKLRYVALVSNGSISFINRMLKFIFNGNAAWDVENKKYMYIADCTYESGAGGSLIDNAFNIELRIGAKVGLSAQFVNLLNDYDSGIMPTFAGSKVTAIQES